MRCFVALLVLATCSMCQAEILQPGLNVTILAPPEAATSTSENHLAIDPDGNTWWSGGTKALKSDGNGGWSTTIPYHLIDGGPLANNSVSTSIAFDLAGKLYINDFGNGQIFRTDDDGANWQPFADLPNFISDMKFDGSGNMIAITRVGSVGDPNPNNVWKILPDGTVSNIGLIHGSTFTFDDGNIIAPMDFGTGIVSLVPGGSETTLWTFDQRTDPGPELWESITMSDAGNYLIGVNLGANDPENPVEDANFSKIIRVDRLTGERTILGFNVGGSIPADMQMLDSSLYVAGYASLDPLQVTGNLDGEFGPLSPNSVPEPSSWLAFLLVLPYMFYRRMGKVT